MRLLIYTHVFAPQVGGVETVVMLLAQGLAPMEAFPRRWLCRGSAVVNITPTKWPDMLLPPDRLERELGDVAAVILPSLGGEVFGMASAENRMRGRLVVVSDVGSLGEVVGEESLKFRSGDAADTKRYDDSEALRQPSDRAPGDPAPAPRSPLLQFAGNDKNVVKARACRFENTGA